MNTQSLQIGVLIPRNLMLLLFSAALLFSVSDAAWDATGTCSQIGSWDGDVQVAASGGFASENNKKITLQEYKQRTIEEYVKNQQAVTWSEQVKLETKVGTYFEPAQRYGVCVDVGTAPGYVQILMKGDKLTEGKQINFDKLSKWEKSKEAHKLEERLRRLRKPKVHVRGYPPKDNDKDYNPKQELERNEYGEYLVEKYESQIIHYRKDGYWKLGEVCGEATNGKMLVRKQGGNQEYITGLDMTFDNGKRYLRKNAETQMTLRRFEVGDYVKLGGATHPDQEIKGKGIGIVIGINLEKYTCTIRSEKGDLEQPIRCLQLKAFHARSVGKKPAKWACGRYMMAVAFPGMRGNLLAWLDNRCGTDKCNCREFLWFAKHPFSHNKRQPFCFRRRLIQREFSDKRDSPVMFRLSRKSINKNHE